MQSKMDGNVIHFEDVPVSATNVKDVLGRSVPTPSPVLATNQLITHTPTATTSSIPSSLQWYSSSTQVSSQVVYYW